MTAGYRSHEAAWIGGASASPSFTPAGYRSFEAFWLGGASAPVVVISRGQIQSAAGQVKIFMDTDVRDPKRLRREDEEIIIL